MNFKTWLFNVLKLVDVDGNVIVLMDPKVETFSRRAGLARDAGQRWGCVVCAWLDAAVVWLFGLRDHCTNSVKAGEVE